uniref:Uncharacterized protein n=1 Tax=Oncorhynchus kisutch TaxID=8019 RepID=A0A8C7DGQ6_ONCKI
MIMDYNINGENSLDPRAGLGSSLDPGAGLGSSLDPGAGLGSSLDPGAGLGSSLDPRAGEASLDLTSHQKTPKNIKSQTSLTEKKT